MDWITGISKAIDYIEEHITEPTDYARAAKEACSSPFNCFATVENPRFYRGKKKA